MISTAEPAPGFHLRRRIALVLLGAGLLLAAWAALLPFGFAPARAQEDETRRDAWQQPDRVMDALGIGPGSHVADVGCGEGYFVLRVARRAGPQGHVFGVDLDELALRKLRRRLEEEGLTNVEVISSRADDTMLPAESVEVILVVNAYHEMREADAMLRGMYAALKPGGLLAVIDSPGRSEDDREAHRRAHTIAESMLRDDARRNGFRFLRSEQGFRRPDGERHDWFFLIFQKPTA